VWWVDKGRCVCESVCICVMVCMYVCAANPIGIAVVQIASPHIVSVVSKLPLLVSRL